MDDRWSDPWAPVPHDGAGRGRAVARGLAAIVVGTAGALAHEVRADRWAAAGAVLGLAVAWELLLALVLSRRTGPIVIALVPVAVAGAATAVVGRTTVLVALWSVTVTDAALHRWRPAGRTVRPPAPQGATLAMPLLVASAWWFALGAEPAVPIALVVAAAGVVAAVHRHPARATTVDAAARRGVTWLGDGIATVVTAVVVVPVVYVPGAVVRTASGAVTRRSPQPSTTWQATHVEPTEQRRDATHMFPTTDPAKRRHRLLSTAVVASLGVLVLVVTADDLVPVRVRSTFANGGTASTASSAPPRQDDHIPYSRRRALEGVSFADALEGEQNEFLHLHLVPDEATRYGAGDFAGRFTNTSGGERRSARPPDCACPAYTVWLLGGSAAFGIGQRDDDTIASFMARDGSNRSVSITVRNLAVPGWVLPQEVDAVTSRLDRGEPPPDLVVFYDGYNDAFLATAVSGVAGRVPATMSQLQQQDYDAFRDEVATGHGALAREIATAGGPTAIGELAASHYLGFRRQITADLDRRGIASRFFVQTDAMVAPQHSADAARVEPGLADPADLRAWGTVLATMDARLRTAGVTSLRDLPVKVDAPLFIDSVHTNEAGARLIADAILADVKDQLTRSAPRSGSRPR